MRIETKDGELAAEYTDGWTFHSEGLEERYDGLKVYGFIGAPKVDGVDIIEIGGELPEDDYRFAYDLAGDDYVVSLNGSVEKGGARSGYYGHAGRPGSVGGSSGLPGYVARTTAMKELGVKHASRMNQYFKYGMPSTKVGGRRYVKWPEAKEWMNSYAGAGKGTRGIEAANTAMRSRGIPVGKHPPLPKPPKPPDQGQQQVPQASAKQRRNAIRWADDDLASTAFLENMSKDELEVKVYNNLLDITAREPVSIRAPVDSALQILDEGRFKTQFETGSSEGTFDPEYRTRAENRGMGVPNDIDPTQRPVYGYIQVPGARTQASGYGTIEIRLKSTVKDRTTVTLGDSLFDMHQRRLAAAPALDPTKESWDSEVHTGLGKFTRLKSYIEAQVHGGVSVSDIAEIRVGADAFSWDTGRPLRPYVQPLVDRADELGIKVIYDRDND